MVVSISTIIFVVSVLGITIILFRKIPLLAELTVSEKEKTGFFVKMKDRILNQRIRRTLSGEVILQKLLSKIRVITLKTENKTNSWLSRLRQKSLEKKNNFSGEYWKKIKEKDKSQN